LAVHRVAARRERRLQYGAWFLQPGEWGERHRCRLQAQDSAQAEEAARGKLEAKLPGQVDMMGIMQPVCQLHSTKAFGQFLADLPNYKKPVFIKHILRSNDS